MGSKAGAAKTTAKRKRAGRPKGSKNAFTNLKQSFLDAYQANDGFGGDLELKKFARDNRDTFLNMVTKLLPREIQAEVKHSIMLAPEKITKPEDAGT